MPVSPYVEELNAADKDLWKAKPPLLGWLDIELTERCNNNCIHCYINLSSDDILAKQKELPTQSLKDILKEAASLGCLKVRFTGGEPLLREDFQELYIFARKRGLKAVVFTNATLITPQLAELFSSIPPLDKIEVTLYGMNWSSYEAISRVKGSFDLAWRGIRLLLDKKIPFILKGALLPQNKNEIEEFQEFAKSIPGMDKPPGYSMFFDLRCRHDKEKNRDIKNLRVSAQEALKVLTRRENEYEKNIKEFCAKFTRPPGDRLFSCGFGMGAGCVDAYGNFQGCMLLRHKDTVYKLKGGSLEDGLKNFFPKIREIKAENPHYLSRCAKCFLKGLCEQCPGKSYMEYGTLDTPVEYLCEAAHVQAEYLGLLKKGEKAWEVCDWELRIRDFVRRN